jgi:hypothetical protein
MADYYPALVDTVSRLANNDAEARQGLYKHARSIIVAQLLKRDLQLSEQEITRERVALERAIRKVEAEVLSSQINERKGLTLPAGAVVEPAPTNHVRRAAKNGNIGAMPEWLAVMLFGIALVAGMIAIAGLLYLALN